MAFNASPNENCAASLRVYPNVLLAYTAGVPQLLAFGERFFLHFLIAKRRPLQDIEDFFVAFERRN
jgi:hypothetical protein